MAKTSIELEGFKELEEALRRANQAVESESRRFLKSWSDYAVNQAQKNILNQGAVDTNELIQGIHYVIASDGMSSTIKPSEKADKYAAPLEYGSKPHWPPISALEGWAQRHGIPAFLVARKIAMEGTKPRPFWQPTWEETKAHVEGDSDNFLDAIVRKF